ncbi:hypothetical protein EUGRSUZ_D00462 [Eucalyptus grandis]|uniref:Uncharacterized protein n=2 Tax=Eucalyptus grandis TaxID=71139 RepID=A0ACC3L3I3_EUCGR|nr:hypothetical protein EUGRSUZ_D00462 [Eucalyptus grandis]
MIFIASVLCEGFSFNFPAFDDRIVPEGNASLSTSHVQLTVSDKGENLGCSMGRATYHDPLHLWDDSTGNVADFSTQFSFVIYSEHNDTFADGLTFFHVPNGSDIPSNSSGGHLALVSRNRDHSDPCTTFVAVEFDTCYYNYWDPQCHHVGIDLNNISSVNYTCVNWLQNKIERDGHINASITYGSSTQMLSVLMIDVEYPNLNVAKLSHSVDLTNYLPEWVMVGFSATTRYRFELPTLHSWEFRSNLRVTDSGNRTNHTSPAERNTGDNVRAKESKSWVWSLIGLGSLLLVALVLGFAWFGYRLNRIGEENDVPSIDEEFDRVTGPKIFYEDMVTATNDLADARLLGEGGFGRVYEGCLLGVNTIFAIKKITPKSRQGIKEYVTKVTISRLRHRKLVQLIGWFHEKKIPLLIYEFISNGSLDSLIQAPNLFDVGKAVLNCTRPSLGIAIPA